MAGHKGSQDTLPPFIPSGAPVLEIHGLRKTYGKMVYELRPSVDWHKGKAVEWLMEQFKKTSEEGEVIFPVYIGDDVTDEDAFAVMGELGGIGLCVSETARDTAARFGLRSPAEVVSFLEHFIDKDGGETTERSSISSRSASTSVSSAYTSSHGGRG